MLGLRGLGADNVNPLDLMGGLALGTDGTWQVIGPPSLTVNSNGVPLTAADIAAYNAAFPGAAAADSGTAAGGGGTLNPLNCVGAACGQLNPGFPTTNPPFCGTGSKQLLQGVDNCTLIYGAAALVIGVIALTALQGRGRR